jgi:hypothetical protein
LLRNIEQALIVRTMPSTTNNLEIRMGKEFGCLSEKA